MSAPGKFVFVVHPRAEKDVFRIPQFAWAKGLPKGWTERLVAGLGPFPLFKLEGINSPQGPSTSGWVVGLLATPKAMLARRPESVYRLLAKAARWGEARGATIMGLGAFTSVVGDAGVTVAKMSPIAVTTGNALTVAATLATLDALVEVTGRPLALETVTVVGGTGSIGYAVARLLAGKVGELRLLGRDAQKAERMASALPAPAAWAGADPAPALAGAGRVVSATSSGGEAIPLGLLEPGAAVLDLALPPDVPKRAEAERPDCLFLEAGEIYLPGRPAPDFDWPLPPGVAYACEAETALLALTGRLELATVGREIEPARVEAVWALAEEHGFEWAGFRSFGREVGVGEVAAKCSRRRD